MNKLVVLLNDSPQSRKLHADGHTRPSRMQLIALAEENARHVEKCLRAIQCAVPAGVEVQGLRNLNAVIVTCPSTSEVERLRDTIRAACSDVRSITADCRLDPIFSRADAAPGS